MISSSNFSLFPKTGSEILVIFGDVTKIVVEVGSACQQILNAQTTSKLQNIVLFWKILKIKNSQGKTQKAIQ